MLDYPKVDPHGEPIPDSKGRLANAKKIFLSQIAEGCEVQLKGVTSDEKLFLDFLNSNDLQIGDN